MRGCGDQECRRLGDGWVIQVDSAPITSSPTLIILPKLSRELRIATFLISSHCFVVVRRHQ